MIKGASGRVKETDLLLIKQSIVYINKSSRLKWETMKLALAE